MFKRALTSVAAVAVICGGVAAVATATKPDGSAWRDPTPRSTAPGLTGDAGAAGEVQASCSARPTLTDLGDKQQFSVVCTVPKPPPVTVTVTATPTTAPTTSATPTQPGSPSPTTTAPTSTTAPTAPTTTTPSPTPPQPGPGRCAQPNATNTGPTGALSPYTGPMVINAPGTVVENKQINGRLVIAAPNVTVRNSASTSTILFARGSDGGRVTDFSGMGVHVSSARNIVVERSDLTGDGSDTLHVTSDDRERVQNVTIRNNWVHDPYSSPTAHYDGLQVRGADGVLVECNTIDLGSYQDAYNAAVYLENDNGGYSDARVLNNWLYGGAFNVMLGSANDGGVIFSGNRMGGDVLWGLCMAQDASAKPAEQVGNTLNGAPVTPCT